MCHCTAALSIKGCYLEDPNQHPISLVPINSRRTENVTVTAAIVLNGAPSQLANFSTPALQRCTFTAD